MAQRIRFELSAVNKTKAAFAGVRRGLDRVKKAVFSLKGAFVGLLSAAAISGTFRKLIGAALPFNEAIAEASTLIEGNARELDFLRESARKMAAQFGGTGAKQVKAFYQAISAGAGTVEEAARLLDTANRFAIGGVTDLVNAVDVLTTATNAYKQSGLTAADASDILFVGIKAGKTNADELGASIGSVASIAASAGLKFDQLVGAVAALTASGIQTTEAVTGMRAILVSLLKPSEEARKLAKRLGIEFNVAGLKSKGFAGFLADVIEKTGGSREELATLFGNVRALGPIFAFTGAAGDKFNETMEAMADRLGVAQEAADKVGRSLSQRLKVQLGALGVKVEEAGSALLRVLVPAMEFVARNGEAAMVVLKALGVALLGPVLGGIIAVTTGLKQLRDLLGLGNTAVSQFENATDNLVASMGDEIKQTQLLSGLLHTSNIMSVEAARVKLAEAKTRLQNVTAIIAEARALALGSERFAELTGKLSHAREQLAVFSNPLADLPEARAGFGETFKAVQSEIVALTAARDILLKTPPEFTENAAKAAENIRILEDAIAKAKAGMVAFGGAIIEPITRTARLAAGAREAAEAVGKISEKFPKAIESAKAFKDEMNNGVGGAFDSATDSILNWALGAKVSFRDVANSIISDLIRINVKLLALNLSGGKNDSFGGIFGSLIGSLLGGGGGKVGGGGGITKGLPVPMSIGAPSSIPANIGAAPSGNMTVQIVNNTPATITEERATGPSGEDMRRFVIDTVGSEMSRGGFDSQQRERFGSAPLRVRR